MSRNRNPKVCVGRPSLLLARENSEARTTKSKHLTLVREMVDTKPPLKEEHDLNYHRCEGTRSLRRSLGREEHGIIEETPALPFKRNFTDASAQNMSRNRNPKVCVGRRVSLSCENTWARRQSKHLTLLREMVEHR